jgi:hypothetical protein
MKKNVFFIIIIVLTLSLLSFYRYGKGNLTVDAASFAQARQETTCVLKHKIPIPIVYFTAWVNDSGEICFYNDIYLRDDHLAELLFSDDLK